MAVLQNILNKYCVEKINGLLLLSMPTGFGKTHNVLDFIYDNYHQFKEQNRKIIFVTNLKKNLPYNDLKERFIKNNRKQEFEENVLFIDSNLDFVIKNLLDLESEIPQQFKESENYQQLRKKLKQLNKEKNTDQDFQQWLKNEIRTKYEPKFRQEITQELNKKSKNKQQRLQLIKNDSDYQWIGKLI